VTRLTELLMLRVEVALASAHAQGKLWAIFCSDGINMEQR